MYINSKEFQPLKIQSGKVAKGLIRDIIIIQCRVIYIIHDEYIPDDDISKYPNNVSKFSKERLENSNSTVNIQNLEDTK